MSTESSTQRKTFRRQRSSEALAPSADLHVKYRPRVLDDVAGHAEVVRSLRSLLERGAPHTYLFAGPAGVGKTTLARIVAARLSAEVQEIDAAVVSGVEAMRDVTKSLHYKALSGARKFIIVDECHALSSSAWKSLLKVTEEPPAHVFFAFCTTELDKVPATIRTRAHTYVLKPLSSDDIEGVLEGVCELEGIELDEDSVRYIARQSEGSVRAALVALSMSRSADSLAEVKRLVSQADEGKAQVELFRLLVSRQPTWAKVMTLLEKTEVGSYESLRIGLVNYAGAVLAKQKSPKGVASLADVVAAFEHPFQRSTEKAQFYLALAELLA